MNHDAPREIADANGKPTGRWHYTRKNSRGSAYPIGFCSPWVSCPECEKWQGDDGITVCQKCDNRHLVRSETPCPGHATPEEACEHYRQYLLSEIQFRGPKTQASWPKEKCRVDGCNNEGTHLAQIPGYHWTFFDLCEQHYNVESISPLIVVGESFHS